MAKADPFCNRAEAYEAHDDVPLSPPERDSIGDVILKRYSRREMVRGSLGVIAAATLFRSAAARLLEGSTPLKKPLMHAS
jgi:hypothetical protein